MKAALGLFVALGLATAQSPSAATQAHWAIGRDLYRENCSVCHDIDKDKAHSRKLGPSLNRLFKNPTLPLSHGKPSRAYVEVRVKYGGVLMPAFGTRLTGKEIETLIDYIGSK